MVEDIAPKGIVLHNAVAKLLPGLSQIGFALGRGSIGAKANQDGSMKDLLAASLGFPSKIGVDCEDIALRFNVIPGIKIGFS